MIAGIDVHAGYSHIDYRAVAAAGYRFVYAKCAEGNEARKDDLTWRRNVTEAAENGLAVGVYSVPWMLPYGDDKPAGRHPVEQAERFFARCKGFGSEAGTLPPAVDIEWPPPELWAKWGCTAPQISAWLEEHCKAVERLWGRVPLIYSYPAWWRELARGADVSWASRYPLWWANYGWPGEGTPPDGWTPPSWHWQSTWTEWAICQHSAQGSSVMVPGVPACPVDRNVIRDEQTLQRLLGIEELTPGVDYRAEAEPKIVHVISYNPIYLSPDDDPPPDAA